MANFYSEKTGPTALFEENVQIKEENRTLKARLEQQNVPSKPMRDGGTKYYISQGYDTKKENSGGSLTCFKYIAGTIFVLLACALVAIYTWHNVHQVEALSKLVSSLGQETENPQNGFQIGFPWYGSQGDGQSLSPHLNIGLRKDESLQECNAPYLKRTFPDVDYALLGFNILKGYPMAIGRDPGFTHPIFQANYTGLRQTADCRFSIPAGLTIIPDVSCVTSFISEEVKSSYEFSRSLSTQATVSGGGWGVSFSASAGYKEASSQISSGQTVYVISKASCDYYYSSLNTVQLPPFDDDFISWAELLASNYSTNADVEEFVEYYGTHFPTDVKFGAKFVYQHKMTTSSYQYLSRSSFSVSSQASYRGLFSIGGGFDLSSEQKRAAESFSSKVETTTISVGAAPPSNGDAMTWASTVKDTPVPTQYSLESIDKLFTEHHMKHMSFNYTAVKQKLYNFLFTGAYCNALLDKGIVDSCSDMSEHWVIFNDLSMHSHAYSQREAQLSTCVAQCLQDKGCNAIMYCDPNDPQYKSCSTTRNCQFLGTVAKLESESYCNHKIKLIILPAKLTATQNAFHIRHAWVKTDVIKEREPSKSVNTENECRHACENDMLCSAFNYCDKDDTWCENLIHNCRLYTMEALVQPIEIDPFEYKTSNTILEIIKQVGQTTTSSLPETTTSTSTPTTTTSDIVTP